MQLDIWVLRNRSEKRSLNLAPGDVSRMNHTARAVPTFLRKVQSVAQFSFRKRRPEPHQITDAAWPLTDHRIDDIRVGDPAARGEGILNVCFDAVRRVQHGRNAALGPGGCGIVRTPFCDHQHLALIGGLQGEGQPGDPTPYDKKVTIKPHKVPTVAPSIPNAGPLCTLLAACPSAAMLEQMRRLAMILFTVACSSLLAPDLAGADIWRCRVDGETHFTNVAPNGARARRRCRKVVETNSQRRQSRAQRRRGPSKRRSGTRLSDRYQRYNDAIAEAARLYKLPVSFLRSVIQVESDFTHDVVSHAGAMGMMQLMPRTAAAMGVRDPFDARQNIFGGARYLRILANLFNGDLILTIAAYNAGEGAVMRHKGIPPYAETQRYVRNVLRRYYDALQRDAERRDRT